MQKLTEKNWEKFKSDGKLFETLIGDLLNAEYPNCKFEHTKWSHDGGKDFEGIYSLFDDDKKIWAECKYHSKSLPIHDVSMTLFMAYVESVCTILFFSYKPINGEFIKYIELYTNKSKKNVKIFADATLEELIFKHKDKIPFEDYFGNAYNSDYTQEYEPVTIKYWHNKQGYDKKRAFHVHDTTKLELAVYNHTSSEIKIKYMMRFNKRSENFIILDNIFKNNNYIGTIIVPPNGIAGKTFELRLERFKSNLSFPSLEIIIDSNNKIIKRAINEKPTAIWLAETPLLGAENNQWLDFISNFLNLNSAKTIGISGRSGTGKSRMINEIRDSAKLSGYFPVVFDSDDKTNLSFNDFIKKMVSVIEDIPNISYLSKKTKSKILDLSDNSNLSELVVKIISNELLDYKEISYDIKKYLIQGMKNRKIFLAMDNIQFYDELILDIIKDIIFDANLEDGFVILISNNEDYTYKDSLANKIIKKIEYMSNSKKTSFAFKLMKDFSPKTALKYLKLCLNMESISQNDEYIKTFENIINRYGTNPFYLQNYLLYLYQKKIIDKIDGDTFYISNVEKFQETLYKIPQKIIDLVNYREELFFEEFVKKNMYEEEYELFVSSLALLRWIPNNLLKRIHSFSADMINQMLTLGFIRQNEDMKYGFYHQFIEKYYQTKYNYMRLPDDKLLHICNTLEKSYYNKLYIERIFLLKYQLNNIDVNIFNEIKKKLLRHDIDYRVTYDVLKAIDMLISSNTFAISSEEYCSIYKSISDLCTMRVSTKGTNELLKSVYGTFFKNEKYFNNNLLDVVGLLKEYLYNQLHMNKTIECIETADEITALLDKSFSNNEKYKESLLIIYFSKIFAYKKNQDINNAVKTNDKVLDIAKHLSDSEYLIRAWYTRGDIYYTYMHVEDKREIICECWKNAYRLYIDSDINEEEGNYYKAIYLEVLNRYILCGIIYKNYYSIAKEFEVLCNNIGKTNMPYFEIKMRLIYIVYNICICNGLIINKPQQEILKNHLDYIIDQCTLYGNQSLLLDCFHMYAIYYRCSYDYSMSPKYYGISYNIMNNLLESNDNQSNWANFIADIIISSRLIHNYTYVDEKLFQLNGELLQYIKNLIKMSETDFKDFIEQYDNAIHPMYNENLHIYFPKI